MNWQSDEWFNKYHYQSLTEDFKQWWVEFYGTPEEYDDQDEYWVRCAFALLGGGAAYKLRQLSMCDGLLPCPFCGNHPQKRIHPGGQYLKDFYYTYHQCATEGCLANKLEIKTSDHEKWNKRN